MTAQQVELRPQSWTGFSGWEVFADGWYAGLIGLHGGEGFKPAFRAYGVGKSLDGDPVAVEAEFPSRDEAVEWLLDGAGS